MLIARNRRYLERAILNFRIIHSVDNGLPFRINPKCNVGVGISDSTICWYLVSGKITDGTLGKRQLMLFDINV